MRKAFQRTLGKQGIKFKLNTKVKEAKTEGNMVKLRVEPSKGGDEETMEADIVLLSAGEGIPSLCWLITAVVKEVLGYTRQASMLIAVLVRCQRQAGQVTQGGRVIERPLQPAFGLLAADAGPFSSRHHSCKTDGMLNYVIARHVISCPA